MYMNQFWINPYLGGYLMSNSSLSKKLKQVPSAPCMWVLTWRWGRIWWLGSMKKPNDWTVSALLQIAVKQGIRLFLRFSPNAYPFWFVSSISTRESHSSGYAALPHFTEGSLSRLFTLFHLFLVFPVQSCVPIHQRSN